MEPKILLFQVDSPREDELRNALASIGIPIRVIKEEEYLQPIGQLAGMEQMSGVHQLHQGTALPNEMLLMAGFRGGQISELLSALKLAKIRVLRKAILTKTNQHWDAMMLYAELSQEHDALQQKPKERQSQPKL